MTSPIDSPENMPPPGTLSLSFDPASLAQGIRVKPAQFARMCQVSRQTVSRWVRLGLVVLFPDGTLDPAKAAKSVLQKTDPARLRARIFKDATKSVDDWRRQAVQSGAALKEERERVAYLDRFLECQGAEYDLFAAGMIELLAQIAAVHPDAIRAHLEAFRDACCMRADAENGIQAPSDGYDEAFAALVAFGSSVNVSLRHVQVSTDDN